jgi:hypothetical protein
MAVLHNAAAAAAATMLVTKIRFTVFSIQQPKSASQ